MKAKKRDIARIRGTASQQIAIRKGAKLAGLKLGEFILHAAHEQAKSYIEHDERMDALALRILYETESEEA